MKHNQKEAASSLNVDYQLSKVRSQGLLVRNDSPKKKLVEIGQYKYDP